MRIPARAKNTSAAFLIACAFFAATDISALARHSAAVPVPVELRSPKFHVTVDGKTAYFLNAAANYCDLNLIVRGRTKISITAPTDDYWTRGVKVQPWRENIRPQRNGATITFTIDHPAKLAISRPGEPLGGAEILFIFANPPELHPPTAASKGVRFFAPGIHSGGIDVRSGERIYLAPGAVILGGVNLWDVHNVRIFGLGTILYDGPQNPEKDEGWMNKPDWHAIVMHNARNIDIRGITCIVRSRTWMIQMRDSRFILFDNVKVIGGSAANANQDGMDWLGGGDTIVRNSFIRAADDIFAMQGNWDGYDAELMKVPGHDVENILIENSVLSTSISNVVRAGWPTKTFNSSNFTMRNSDVIQMGIGGCGIPFALLEIWGVPDAHGTHSNYLFDDIRLEDWYSLVQLQQIGPQIRDMKFSNIWAIDQAASTRSSLLGDVSGITFENVRIGDRTANTAADLQIDPSAGASIPGVSPAVQPRAAFVYRQALAMPNRYFFDASAVVAAHGRPTAFDWFFGDGSTAHGQAVMHTYADQSGTDMDGSGRYRVMLRITAKDATETWTSQPVIVKTELSPPQSTGAVEPGLRFSQLPVEYPSLNAGPPVATGITPTLNITFPAPPYAFLFEGLIDVPTDGGYSFTELSRDGSKLTIDGVVVLQNPPAWAQVCGSVGNAVQQASGTIGLSRGAHTIRIEMSQNAGDEAFALLWQGPGIPLTRVPDAGLSHAALPN